MHALETDHLKMLRQQAFDSAEAFDIHRHKCSSCSWAVRDNDPWRYCEPGYQLAKFAKRADHALTNAKLARDQSAAVEQDTLF